MTDQTLPRPVALPEVIAPAGASLAPRPMATPALRVITVKPLRKPQKKAGPQPFRHRAAITRTVVASLIAGALASIASAGWILARVGSVVHVMTWLGIGAAVVACLVLAVRVVRAARARRTCPGMHCPDCKG